MSLRASLILTFGLLALPTFAAEDHLPSAISQFNTMHNGDALRSFLKLQEQNPVNPEIQYYLGRLYQRTYRYDQARKWLRQAVELDPLKADYRVSLCEALGAMVERSSLIDQISMAAEVHKNLIQAVANEPDSIRARDALMHYYLEAPTLAGGSSRKALNQAEAIAKIDRGFGHIAYGDIALVEKRYNDASEAYSAAANLLPKDPSASYQLARTYQMQEKFLEAKSILDGILKRFPNESAVYYYFAENLILSKKLDEPVIHLLETYIKKGPRRDEDPQLTQAYLELGHVQQQLNHRFRARLAYKAALALDPEDEEARTALQEVD